MEAIAWVLLPVFTATGSALLAFLIMQARMEVTVARERQSNAEATARLQSLERLTEEKIRAAQEESRRRSFDDFLADIRVEERHYMKESKSLFMNRKSMVLQERLFFRNVPLSEWVSRELAIEEGSDVSTLVKAWSIFSSKALPANGHPVSGLLES